jgi:predicted DNA-binding protein YlxM (UPF0122 family)
MIEVHSKDCLTFQQLAELWGVSKQAIRTKMIRWGLYRKSQLIGCYVNRQELREKLTDMNEKLKNKKE